MIKECLSSYHIMIPAERESLAVGQRSLKAKSEKPFQVSWHLVIIKMSWPMFGNHDDNNNDIIAPVIPNPNLIVKSQDNKRWTTTENAAK